ncbi:hypothetical protein SDC9_154697 [bioreactor metagenome]|uniref:Uncharacterized protein n=1 Tax=bioreactor metagenome TaxID=1076179 RepID=A0A645EZR2_9ZZZZ
MQAAGWNRPDILRHRFFQPGVDQSVPDAFLRLSPDRILYAAAAWLLYLPGKKAISRNDCDVCVVVAGAGDGRNFLDGIRCGAHRPAPVENGSGIDGFLRGAFSFSFRRRVEACVC